MFDVRREDFYFISFFIDYNKWILDEWINLKNYYNRILLVMLLMHKTK